MERGQIVPPASDFDFAVGDWYVKHRRLRERLAGCTDWVEFDGEMSTRKVLGGYGNVEDNLLHLPDGPYRALALRSFDPRSAHWSIWWLDGRAPERLELPVVGKFESGIGTFYGKDTLNGAPVRVRFNWFTADPARPRWEQAFSCDGGTTWETNWTMDFVRSARSRVNR
jgi:hypothetical protein